MAPPAPTFPFIVNGAWFLRTGAIVVKTRAPLLYAGYINSPAPPTLEYTINGGASWSATGVTLTTAYTLTQYPPDQQYLEATFTIAANTFADEATIQIRSRYYHNDLAMWSNYGYLNIRAANAPAAPTITVPATNGTGVGKIVSVSWTSAEVQSGYDLEVRTASGGGGTVVYSESNLATSTQTTTATMDVTAVTRYIRVRTYYNGIVGAWAERSVVTAFLNPEVPTFTTSKIDPSGLGIFDTILFTITNPTPSGGRPPVTDMSIQYRRAGSADNWTVIDSSIGMTPPFRWRAPHGSWEFAVRAYAASFGTETYSLFSSPQPQTVTLRGVLLNLASTPLTGMWMLFNGGEAEESYEIESALVQYAGRPFPVAEFGDAATNTIEVAQLQLKTRDELLKLQALLLARDVVLYRDRRGRRMYGLLTLTDAKDTIYGYEIGLRIDRLDYTNAAEIGQL